MRCKKLSNRQTCKRPAIMIFAACSCCLHATCTLVSHAHTPACCTLVKSLFLFSLFFFVATKMIAQNENKGHEKLLVHLIPALSLSLSDRQTEREIERERGCCCAPKPQMQSFLSVTCLSWQCGICGECVRVSDREGRRDLLAKKERQEIRLECDES